MDNLQKIIDGEKTLLSYFTYPVGTRSAEHIAVVDEDDDSPQAISIRSVTERLLDAATKILGFSRDNKTAVKCEVNGINQPLYFVWYDRQCMICSGLDISRGTEEHRLESLTFSL